MLGPHAEVEDGLVRVMWRRFQTRNIRKRGRGARGNNVSPCLDADLISHHHRFRIGKAGLSVDDPDAQSTITFLRIIRRDRCDHIVHVLVHLVKIDLGAAHENAEVARSCDRMRRSRRLDQRLGWNAAGVKAVASHLSLLDEHGGNPETRSGGSNGEAA
jgi:hypothetical protein